jgi:hypothetical protein
MTTTKIDIGDRIYATETLNFVEGNEPERIVAGTEGTVIKVWPEDTTCCDLTVEWDSGYLTAADSTSVALVHEQAGAR